MNYSLLIMVGAGMMKMATGDDFPLRRSAGTGSRLVFMDTEACGGGTSDLGLPRGFLEYLTIHRAKRRCGRPPRWAQPTWARVGPQARPHGLCPPRGTPQVLPWPTGGLLVHKKSTKNQLEAHSGTLPDGEIITSGHLHHPGAHHDEEGVVHPRG